MAPSPKSGRPLTPSASSKGRTSSKCTNTGSTGKTLLRPVVGKARAELDRPWAHGPRGIVPPQDGGCSLRLSLYHFETGVETIGGNRVVHDLGRGIASFGAATVDGPALVWQFDHDEAEAEGALLTHFVQLDPFAAWIVRCDRIDFPLGATAPAHTHPGPGIRYLLQGEIEIETEGRAAFYGPGGAWFESGPDPVVARASAHLDTSFVRALVLPAEWAGKRTIRYVEPRDAAAARQSASVLLEHPIALPR